VLQIRYLDKNQQTEISITEDSPVWAEILGLLEEKVGNLLTVNSANNITIPWWVFLSCREEIAYGLRKHRYTDFVFDEKASSLLMSSLEKQRKYEQVGSAGEVDPSTLQQTLNAKGFTRELTKEQQRNVAKLVTLPAGASFSVPGAGKTTEALAFYYYYKNESSKLLVVAPKNAFPAWEEQIKLCVVDPPNVLRLRGGYQAVKALLQIEPTVMLITYQQLPNVLDLIAEYITTNSVTVFLDESHRIKRGNDGIIGSSVLSISHIPDRKLVLSGTPMPNSVEDLVPQFTFLYPEINPDKNNIERYIKPVYVRTTKAELNLPKVKYFAVPVSMTPNQRKLYQLIRSEEARKAETLLNARERNQLRLLGKSVLRLIQLTSNPSLLAKTDFQYHDFLRDVLLEGDSPKIKYVCNRVRELAKKGKKTIVWSSFVENVELLSMRLRDLGADYIHGGVEAGSDDELDTREAKIKRFHYDPNAYVLIANPAAAGEGISLHTVCHNAIYLDRNYNAAQFLQSVDRIHRLGLERHIVTSVEIVYCNDSIDESVDRRINAKIDKMSQVLNDSSIKVEYEYADEEYIDDYLNREDLEDLLNHLKGL
jgi:SNF2 family DNA or RNA helicase